MKHPESHLVTKTNGPRPAGRPTECFYCNEQIGRQHKADCVLKKRTVVVRVSIELLMEMPDYKTPPEIVDYLNESTYCADNLVGQIEQTMEVQCLCDIAHCEFLREATPADEKRHGYKNEDF